MPDDDHAFIPALLIDRTDDVAGEGLDVVAYLIERAERVRRDINGHVADILDEESPATSGGIQDRAPDEECVRLQRAPRSFVRGRAQQACIIDACEEFCDRSLGDVRRPAEQ